MNPRLIPVILGPTGVGKSGVAFELARRYGWEIVSVDSRQCYQLMEIGTAKPISQMRDQVPHHLLDLCPPDHQLSAGEFARHAWELLLNLEKPLAVGGSGFYLRAIFEPLHANLPHNPIIREELETLATPTLARKLKAEDPLTAERLHPNDRQRIIRALEVCLAARRPYSELIAEPPPDPPVRPFYVGLKVDRHELINRQAKRLERMMAQGFVEEVRRLRDMGFPKDLYAFNAYGYRDLYEYIDGDISLAEARQLILKKIRAFAKRQMTFFRTLGEIHWVEAADPQKAVREVKEILSPNFPHYFQ
ncbi:tRNA (adenosine(37)-N6)-dimethylallyltransferase MiaA [candidate division WOR-3 bacterium]|nr:tRNA (adenosine(37)-N6)-dimethylallyltransferase MiaA [candidate division WOR-3 bacterium]